MWLTKTDVAHAVIVVSTMRARVIDALAIVFLKLFCFISF
jgi:hypothetical protein